MQWEDARVLGQKNTCELGYKTEKCLEGGVISMSRHVSTYPEVYSNNKTKVAQVLWPLYRDFHHKALYSVLQKQLQAALNALLQKTVTDVSRKKQT